MMRMKTMKVFWPEGMKVFWVFGWDQYYPNDDNFLASFDNESDAQRFVTEHSKHYEYRLRYDHYEIVNIADRL